ncbi:NDR1/HIN1-like protein 10 [Ricinus communis]|uniref:Uncharacterized protein n=1 Tax=Ricinus communis TaxID=3988 RepID=B9T2S3_RICCO|nr:NDR1/HIN1-like protein 10 [Ricinus communis]EEF29836.1 conserved hypothetical protein [Ricinus communis]|eukprot:XP_002532542.1 NDR1/HIN1-like protein 10 [Ricinus communis]
MASSQSDDYTHDHHQPKKEPGQSSSDGSDSPPPGGPSRATGYPPPMGYAPPMMYPPPGQYPYPPPAGQPVGYPNYNNGYNNNYPYAQAPPTAYYNTQMYQTQPECRINGFLRGIIGGLVFLLILTCAISIFMWIILRPVIPVFHVNNLSVSNFNLSSSPTFHANWDANITVGNPNTKLKVYFDQIEVFIYYNEDDLLATSFSNPFFLETGGNSVVQAKLEANNADRKQAGVGSWVVDKMAKDKSTTGNVTFDIRMALWSTFKSGSWWARHVTIRVYCEDLVVSFMGNSGTANFANGKSKDCLVFA